MFGAYNPTPAAEAKATQTIAQLSKDKLLKDFIAYTLTHLNIINTHSLFKLLRTLKRSIDPKDQ